MKRYLFFIAITSAVILFTQCKTSKPTAKTPDDARLAAAQKRWPDVTMAALNEGQSIYNNQCTNCHGAKPIPKYNEFQWNGYINAMAPKAKLTPQQTDNLRKYIYTERSLVPSN